MYESKGILKHLQKFEKHNTKNLYKKARLGNLKNFSGIGSEYKIPSNQNLIIITSYLSPKECVKKLLLYIFSTQEKNEFKYKMPPSAFR